MNRKPKRIQRKRTKGWRMPPGAVYVGRPSKWGNEFSSYTSSALLAVQAYRTFLLEEKLRVSVADVRRELAGKDLACWCPLEQPCHADVLLDVANGCPKEVREILQ